MKIDFTSDTTWRRRSSDSSPRGSISGKSRRDSRYMRRLFTTVKKTVAIT